MGQLSQYDSVTQVQIYQAINDIPNDNISLIATKGLQKIYRLKPMAGCRILFTFDKPATIRLLSIDTKSDIFTIKYINA